MGECMDGDEARTSLGIEVFTQALRRQWQVVALGAILGLLLATGYLALAPREYTASATVNLTVISTEPFAGRSAPSSLLDEQEERAIAQSSVVASRAAETRGLGMTAREIRSASHVSTSSGAAVVTVYFTADSAERAAAGADAVAGAYLSYRQERAEERIAQLVDGLDGRIEELTSRIAEIDGELGRLEGDSPARAQLASEREQRETERTNFLGQRNDLQGVDTAPGVVLTAASDTAAGVSPSAKLALLTGLAMGLVLGVVAAVARDLRDPRLRSAEEVTQALGAPLLSRVDVDEGTVPSRGAEADALRVARERLLVTLGAGATVLMVDACHEDQVSSLPLNLAILTAEAGIDVQLIAPEEPSRTRLRLEGVLGTDRDSLEMPAGGTLTYFGDSAGHMSSQADPLLTARTARAIREAGERILTIVVLTAEAPHGSILAALRQTSAVVLVGGERVTTRSEARWLRDEADAMGAMVLGAIVKGSSRRPARRARGRRAKSQRTPVAAHDRTAARATAPTTVSLSG